MAEESEGKIIESQIETAMRSRVSHFKEQSDSLTFEGVRRLLEKDLGLKEYALDVHKRFIKQCLITCLEGVGDDHASKISGKEGEKSASTQESEGLKEESELKDVKDSCPEDEEKMEDSPVLGLLKEQKRVKRETKGGDKGNGNKVVLNEALIKKAVRKRSPYIKANAESVTMAGLRRLLEEDLKLEKFTLDPYKKFISQQLDEVLASFEVKEPAQKIVKKKPDTKITKKASSEENSDNSDKETDEEESLEDEIEPKKKVVSKGKMQTSVRPKKRKELEEINLSNRIFKRAKPAKAASEENSDAEDNGKNSEDDQSDSSPEKPSKKKEVSTPVYGKRVEHLKSVIKACGMSVPPAIYKKVKQVPENKREGQLVKELEEILSREGLSSNPSEKEIKDVKRKKARAKELEGIELSNIVLSSRRRSTTSFASPPPPKPKVPKVLVETSGNEAEGDDNEEDDEDNDNEEDEEDEEEDISDDDGSQSEEFNDDEEDSD
ncbi:hypothetical protein Fmac_007738 [Flemingia macrophylla]|uniref:Histone chaperone domain-containing protein n=1 Tax=Flemingia macrophylla TaxID=520843 RepID=A0ABD1MWH7_9FABA